jgi:hypothetical protein
MGMGEWVRIAVRKDGEIRTGTGHESCARVGGSFALQSGDSNALEALFGAGGSGGLLIELGGPEGVVPEGEGLVCIDLDRKRVDSHQLHCAVGDVEYGVLDFLRDRFEDGDVGSTYSPFTATGMFVEAYRGGALEMKDESGVFAALSCEAETLESARSELLERFGRVHIDRTRELFKMRSPGWEYEEWDHYARRDAGTDCGLAAMALSLMARDWPLTKDMLADWRCYDLEYHGESHAGMHDGWFASRLEALEIDSAAGGLLGVTKKAARRM